MKRDVNSILMHVFFLLNLSYSDLQYCSKLGFMNITLQYHTPYLSDHFLQPLSQGDLLTIHPLLNTSSPCPATSLCQSEFSSVSQFLNFAALGILYYLMMLLYFQHMRALIVYFSLFFWLLLLTQYPPLPST